MLGSRSTRSGTRVVEPVTVAPNLRDNVSRIGNPIKLAYDTVDQDDGQEQCLLVHREHYR